MKKSILIASTLAMVLGVGVAVGARQGQVAKADALDKGDTVYLKAGTNWMNYSGKFAVYMFGDGDGWCNMTKLYDDYFSATIPSNKNYTTLIFVRSNPEMDPEADHWDARWSQTVNITFESAGANNLYTIPNDAGTGNDVTGSWSSFTPDMPDEDGYYIVGTESNWKFDGATKLTTLNDDPSNYAKLEQYQAAKDEEFKVKSFINKQTQWFGVGENSDNYVADSSKKVNVYASKDGKLYVSDYVAPDVPATDGYYLVGSKTNFKYNGATSIPALAEPDAHHNVAILRGYSAAAGEKIKARSYFSSVDTWFDSGDGTIEDVGAPDGDKNFVFTTAGSYDIFVQKNGENKAFYVAVHQEFVNIGVVNRFFTGKTMTSYENGADQDCVKGQKPTLIDPYVNGYVFRGWFTNAGCTEAFDEDTVLNNDITLQAKFTKVGYYTISEAGNWSVDNADPMTTEDIGENNNAETSVTIAAVGERYSFIYYDADGVMHGQTGVGANDGIATYDSEKGNVVFSKAGTFAVYLSKDGNVYLNAGAAAFYTNFLNDVSAVCNTVGTEGYIENLQAEWAEQKVAYTNLTESEQNAIKAVGFDGGSDVDDLHKVVKKYNRIVTKYGSALFEDFIWGQKNIEPQTSVLYPSPIAETSNVPVFVIVAATITAISVGLFFILKKKHN